MIQKVFKTVVLFAVLMSSVPANATKVLGLKVIDKNYLMVHFRDGEVHYRDDGTGPSAYLGHSFSEGDDTLLVFGERLKVDRVQQAALWRISSADDKAFGSVRPQHVWRKTKPMNFDHTLTAELDHWLFLQLPKAMKQGCTYTVTIPKGIGADETSLSVCFDIWNAQSEAVHVNIIGYVPSEQTHAADLYQWLGDGGQRNYKVNVRKIYRNKISHVVLFRIEDETKLQRYIQKLDTHNTKLKDVIKDNDRHIRAIQEQMIVGMAKMVESRDSNTGGHIMRTSGIVAIFAEELQKDTGFGRTREFYDALIAAAPMHDLGKIAIDDKILRKPGSFTPEEFEVMKTHAEKGAAIVENLLAEIEAPDFVEIAKNVACFHHERFDGSGYPYGLFGANIPFEARIMAVADVYDALVSKRCYKDQMSFEDAYNLIMDSMGSHFDPRLKPCFVACREKLEHYYRTSPGWESIEK